MKACYDTRVFKGITPQTCAVHLVMPHATMQCPRVFKMANLTVTDYLTHPHLSNNEFNTAGIFENTPTLHC